MASSDTFWHREPLWSCSQLGGSPLFLASLCSLWLETTGPAVPQELCLKDPVEMWGARKPGHRAKALTLSSPCISPRCSRPPTLTLHMLFGQLANSYAMFKTQPPCPS